MKPTQFRVKPTIEIIAEAGLDEYLFRNHLFPSNSLGDYVSDADSSFDIRQSFYDDIAKKFDLPRQALNNRWAHLNIEILRSMAVFGDHQYLVEKLRAELHGTF